MDKYEYKLKLEQLKNLVQEKDYKTAAEIADTVNWRKVKSAATLCLVGEVYDKVKRYEDSREILLMAYDRATVGRNIIYRLTLVALKLGNLDEAKEYYDEFLEVAPYDNLKYVLRYEIAKVGGATLGELIKILEEYKEREYTEEWTFELAYLYHRAGEGERCVDICDELVLWFGDGKYVEKALELKMLYQPLNESQVEKYREFKDRREQRKREAEQAAFAAEQAKREVQPAQKAKEGKMPEETPEKAGVDGVESDMVKIDPTDTLESGEIVHEAIQIPRIMENTSRFNTINLQAELARSMQQIIDASSSESVNDTMDNIKKMVEDIPYLQMPSGEYEEDGQTGEEEEWDETDDLEEQEEIAGQEERAGQVETGELEIQEEQREIAGQEDAGEQEEQREIAGQEERAGQVETGELEIQEEQREIAGQEDAGEQEEQRVFAGQEERAGQVETGELEIQEEQREIARQEEIAGQVEITRQEEKTGQAEQEIRKEAVKSEEAERIGKTAVFEKPKQAGNILKPESMAAEVTLQENGVAGLLLEDEDGQLSLCIGGCSAEPQIWGQMNLEDVLAELEHAKAEKASAEAEKQELDYRKAKALQEAEDIMDRLTGVLPKLDAWLTREAEKAMMEDTDPEGFAPLPEVSEAAKVQTEPDGLSESVSDTETDMEQEEADSGLELIGEEPVELPEWAEEPKAVIKLEAGAELQEIPEIPQGLHIDIDKVEDALGDTREIIFKRDQQYQAQDSWSGPMLQPESVMTDMEEFPEIDMEETFPEEEPITSLSQEQKEIFSYFVPVTGMEQQLCQVLEGVMHRRRNGKSSASGNIVIMGGRGSGKTVLATDIIKVIQKTGGFSNGKVGKIAAASLNQKDLSQLIKKIAGGYLIIEKAGELSQETVTRMSLLMEQDTDGLLVILEDTRAGIEKVMNRDPNFSRKFTERIKIPVFTSDELVEFAKAYANEQECEIDDMAILALYNCISNIQRLDEATTLTEVKEIVDDAIDHAQKGGLKKLLGGRKYSQEGYLYIREKDFIN